MTFSYPCKNCGAPQRVRRRDSRRQCPRCGEFVALLVSREPLVLGYWALGQKIAAKQLTRRGFKKPLGVLLLAHAAEEGAKLAGAPELHEDNLTPKQARSVAHAALERVRKTDSK